MPYGRATPIILSEPERAELESLARRSSAPQGLALRARIVLRCAEGLTNQAVARRTGVCAHTVGKWRERFFALLTDKTLRRGVHRSTAELEASIQAYIAATNADPKSLRWTKPADDILAAVQRFCTRTLGTHAAPV
jgi:DNA-binding CsgD family transcriptional regulator